MTSRHNIDAAVIVIGAGPAGSAAACWLARSGTHVIMVDRAKFPRSKVCGDALSPQSLRLLRELGIGKLCDRMHAIDGSIVIAPSGKSMETFTAEPGAMLPREELDAALLALARAAGTDFRERAACVGLRQAGTHVRCVLRDGTVLRTRFACLATGANGATLSMAGMGAVPADGFGRRAYFERVEGLDSKIVHAFLDPLLPGYGWVFPMGGGRANVGVAVHAGFGPLRLRERFDWFVTESAAARPYLAGARMAAPPLTGAVRTGLARGCLTRGRLLAVGDAAAAACPANGEGIPYALQTARMAADSILEAMDAGRDALAGKLHARKVCGALAAQFSRAEKVRRLLRYPAVMNRIVRGARGDKVFAHRLASALVGRNHPLRVLTPASLFHMLF